MAKRTKNCSSHLRGVITEAHLAEAEREFPGICSFYARCKRKPHTFLELAWRYECELKLQAA